MTTIALEVKSWPRTRHEDEVQVALKIGTGTGDPRTFMVFILRGLECDYLNTLLEDVASAYMYGERPKDVIQAGQDVVRLARAHAVAHSF